MTIQRGTDEQRSLSNGALADTTASGGDVVGRRRTSATTPGPRRAYDYRLRGLDLDAPALAEAPARPVLNRHPSLRRRRRRLLVQFVIVLALIALIAVVLRGTVVESYSVNTSSMVPTLQPGTHVLVVKWRRLTGSVGAGDIVVFHQPEGASCSDGSRDLVKRVIGVPGQTIWSVGQSIYIDGQVLDEPGWYNPPFGEIGPTAIAPTTIPPGSYFVMGDNRTDACDSRAFGPVSGSLVVGEVTATVARDGHLSLHSV